MGNVFGDFAKDIQKTFKKKNEEIEFDTHRAKEPIPTGSVVIDKAFNNGLAYKRRLTELASFESGGKSTIAYLTMVEALKKYPDEAVILLDFEQSFDSLYAKALGLDADDDRVMIYQPRTLEEGDEILQKAFDKQKGGKDPILKHKISLVVVDSVAAARPSQMFEASVDGTGQKSQHANAWTIWVPKLQRWCAESNFAVLLLNQFRAKPQMGNMDKFKMSSTGMGNATSSMDADITTTGGNALRFYLSARYVTKFSTVLKEQVEDVITGEVVEHRTANMYKLTNIKNKINPPYANAKFVIRFGEGIDDFPIVMDALKLRGIVTNRGSFMIYKTLTGEEIKILGKSAFNATMQKEHWEDMKTQFNKSSDDDIIEPSLEIEDEDSEIEETHEL